MSSELDRNPSPPPELMQNDQQFLPDKVGDSVYSKQGLFQVLVHIVESVQGIGDQNPKSPSKEKEESDNSSMDYIVELDPKLEDEACILWDMSASSPVASFLHEHKASELLLDVIDQTKSPRLVEIIVGIFGNMASFNDICMDLSSNKCFTNAMVALSGASDTPTIIQVLRLIHSAVVNTNTKSLWIEALTKEPAFMENMKYILENSLNGDILKAALHLMYYIFDEDETLCFTWSDAVHTKALIDAGRQLKLLEDHAGLDEFWLVLNIVCQYEPNIRSFAQNYVILSGVFHTYFMRFGDHDDVLPKHERISAVSACFNTYMTLLRSECMNADLAREEFFLLGIFHKMYLSICDLFSKSPKTDSSPHSSEAIDLSSPCDEDEMMTNSASDELTERSSSLGTSNGILEEDYDKYRVMKGAIQNTAVSLSLYTDINELQGQLLASMIENKESDQEL